MEERDYLKALRIISESMEWQIVKPRLDERLRNKRNQICSTFDPIQQNRLIGEAKTLSGLIEEVETAREREARYAEADSSQPIGSLGLG